MNKMTRIISLLFISVVLFFNTVSADEKEIAIPAEYVEAIEFVEVYGAEIYMQDIAAWVTTDFLIAKADIGNDKRLKGWVTEHYANDISNPMMSVIFIGEVDGALKGFYRLDVNNGQVIEESYISSINGFELSPSQLSLFNARQSAIEDANLAGALNCSDTYNSIAFSTVDENGSTQQQVYLLAATTNEDAVMLGGHHLYVYNASGKNLVSTEALSKSCFALKKEKDIEALVTTHLLTPTPNEIHVFQSLLHRMPIYVKTTRNNIIWVVEGNNIRVVQLEQDEP